MLTCACIQELPSRLESYSRGRRSAIESLSNEECNRTGSITFLMGFFILEFQNFRQKAPEYLEDRKFRNLTSPCGLYRFVEYL